MSERTKGQLIMLAIILGLTGAVLVLGIFAAFVAQLSAPDARLWAYLSSLAVPVAVLVGYLVGRRDAGQRIAGIDQGIERVSRAASETATLRVGVARAVRAPVPPAPAPTIIDLPLEPVFRDMPRLASGVEEL